LKQKLLKTEAVMNKDVFWDVVGTLMLGFLILMLVFLPEIVEVL
jgi:hypothetical protein